MSPQPKKPSTHWNYRLMAHESKHPISKKKLVFFKMHEIYYTKGKPTTYSTQPVEVHGETKAESMKCAQMMIDGASKEIYYYGDKFPQVYASSTKKQPNDTTYINPIPSVH